MRSRIVLKSDREIDLLYAANQHVAEVLHILIESVAPGISTWDLDRIARDEIAKRPVQSAFLGYKGYPAVLCTSVNQEVVHGIPHKDKKLKEGDIIGIDFGLVYKGYVGDSARTVSVGKQPKASVAELLVVTKRALDKGIAVCEPGARLSEIGRVVEAEAKVHDYGVVRDFVGHGIGTAMHEEPQVPNYYDGPKPKMPEGLVIAIEPMFTLGTERVRVEADGWTAVTLDHSWAAHFEDSLAITSKGPRILSRL